MVGLGLNYAAYEAEIYRAGIASVPAGQWEAAASLGMSRALTFRRIILPQAIRVILPPMTNDFVGAVQGHERRQRDRRGRADQGVPDGREVEPAIVWRSAWRRRPVPAMSVPLGFLSRYLEQRWGKAHGRIAMSETLHITLTPA